MSQIILFYIFAVILVLSALRVVTTKNPVHAALNLVLCFFTGAALWMLMEAEFLAISLVLVYVGAVMVLFLFVVMMLDINFEQLRSGFWKNLPAAIVVGGVMAAEMVLVLVKSVTAGALGGSVSSSSSSGQDYAAVVPMGEGVSNIKQLAVPIYTQYLLPFELAAVLLLVAIIAAISLTLRRRKNTKYQNPAEQIKVKKADRLRIVQMAAVVEVAEAASEGEQTPAA